MPFYGVANSNSAGRIWCCFIELAPQSGKYSTVSLSNFQMLSDFSRRIQAGGREVCTSKTYVVAIYASNYLKRGEDFQCRQSIRFFCCRLSV
jgi:hypothetical protein